LQLRRLAQARPALVGVELVLNSLAPREQNLYFETLSGRRPLGWSAAVSGSEAGSRLKIVDEWQNVAATIEAPSAKEFWITPIETISESRKASNVSIRVLRFWLFGPWNSPAASLGREK
jgi:alpha-amylase/4-alpha-glucanotransferase-like protein